MDAHLIKLAKKYFGNHFLNQFKLIDSWSELPREFRRIMSNPNVFKLYSERGDFLFIKGPEDNYLAHISPKEVTIVSSKDKSLSEFDLGNQLNLNILNLTLKDVVDYLKNRSKNKLSQIKNEGIYRKQKGMKKIIRLTESDLIKLIKKVINEQEFERELPMRKKGILGHKDLWTDEEDRPVNPDEFDYDEEIEFGPDDFEDYISHTETDFPGNKWPFNMKGVKGDDRSPGKGYWDRYQKQGKFKLRKSRM